SVSPKDTVHAVSSHKALQVGSVVESNLVLYSPEENFSGVISFEYSVLTTTSEGVVTASANNATVQVTVVKVLQASELLLNNGSMKLEPFQLIDVDAWETPFIPTSVTVRVDGIVEGSNSTQLTVAPMDG